MANRFGWKRPLPMQKNFMYYPARGALAIPSAVDLENLMPPVYDQGDLGSCTANAGAGLAEFVMKKIGKSFFTPARLAIYYWNRVADGTVKEDAGSSLSQTMTTLETVGVPHESNWWYNPAKFAVKPNKKVVDDASKHIMLNGLSIQQDLNHMRACLAEGFPFMFGFTVYESFESDAMAKNGIMTMPVRGEKILGGHAVLAVGYDDSKNLFKVRNSWGVDWADKGYFYMPYEFIGSNNFADDFWTCHDYRTWKLEDKRCVNSCKFVTHNI